MAQHARQMTIKWISSAGQSKMACAGTIENDDELPPVSDRHDTEPQVKVVGPAMGPRLAWVR